MSKKRVTLEVVVYNIESAVHAQKGGADRIELCDNPLEGGTTPSFGVIDMVRQSLSIDLYVMIRPRGGDFVYSAYEYHAMKKDIEMCKRASADGVVLGILKPDGTLDKDRCRKLIEFARPMKVTCHRAFDVTPDPYQALEDCIEAGFDRILTSGQEAKAIEGTPLIRQLIQLAKGRIAIMPGSGVRESNVDELVAQTGADEVHLSALDHVPSSYTQPNDKVNFLGSFPTGFDWRTKLIANTDRISAVREKLGL